MRHHSIKERLLGRVLEEQAIIHRERVFLNFKGQLQISYRQLDKHSNRFANALVERGIQKGAKVAIMLPNCPEYLYSWFGLAKIGAVMVPVNTAHKGELLQHILSASDSEAIITDVTFLNRLQAIKSDLSNVRHIYVNGWTGNRQNLTPGSSLADFFYASPDSPPRTELKHSDPLTILFTSGTTGVSKGVVMSHHYYYYAAQTIGAGM